MSASAAQHFWTELSQPMQSLIITGSTFDVVNEGLGEDRRGCKAFIPAQQLRGEQAQRFAHVHTALATERRYGPLAEELEYAIRRAAVAAWDHPAAGEQ